MVFQLKYCITISAVTTHAYVQNACYIFAEPIHSLVGDMVGYDLPKVVSCCTTDFLGKANQS